MKTHTSKEAVLQTIASIPLKRAGNPSDVARLLHFLPPSMMVLLRVKRWILTVAYLAPEI
jgi:hypothetical protein